MTNPKNTRWALLGGLIFLAALSRLLPHPPNFTPISAMALFGGAYFLSRRAAFLVPLLAMWVSDLLLNNLVYGAYFESFSWYGNLWVYAAFLVIVLLGLRFLQKVNLPRVVGLSLGASLLFFLVTNFGVWLSGPLYPKTMAGLMEAYAAGLPFLRNTLLGDLFYCGVLFGTFEWLKLRFPALRPQVAA